MTTTVLFNFLGVLFVGIMNRIITLLYRLPFSLVVLFVRASWTNYGFVLAHALEFGAFSQPACQMVGVWDVRY